MSVGMQVWESGNTVRRSPTDDFTNEVRTTA